MLKGSVCMFELSGSWSWSRSRASSASEQSDEPSHVLHLQGANNHVDSSTNVHAAAAERGGTGG